MGNKIICVENLDGLDLFVSEDSEKARRAKMLAFGVEEEEKPLDLSEFGITDEKPAVSSKAKTISFGNNKGKEDSE